MEEEEKVAWQKYSESAQEEEERKETEERIRDESVKQEVENVYLLLLTEQFVQGFREISCTVIRSWMTTVELFLRDERFTDREKRDSLKTLCFMIQKRFKECMYIGEDNYGCLLGCLEYNANFYSRDELIVLLLRDLADALKDQVKEWEEEDEKYCKEKGYPSKRERLEERKMEKEERKLEFQSMMEASQKWTADMKEKGDELKKKLEDLIEKDKMKEGVEGVKIINQNL